MNKTLLAVSLLMSLVPSSCDGLLDKFINNKDEQEQQQNENNNNQSNTEDNGNQNTQDDETGEKSDENEDNPTPWPEELIAQEIAKISPAIFTKVPEFDAESFTVSYNSVAHAVAINGFGYDEEIVNTYKQKLENADWTVSNDNENGYNAISPNEDIKINFYIDDANNNFSVDVFAYVKPVDGWPEAEINNLVWEEMGVTGIVPPYEGKNNGFEINTDYFPYAIYVYVDNGTQASSAAAYNQQLVSAGYEVVGDYFGDVYSQPGTTLGLHGVYLAGNCFTIELFDITMIFED